MDTRSLTLQVASSDGSPIAGANVRPVGMRSKEEPGSCYGWGWRTVPGIDSGASDATGMATITFPAHCRDELTTGTVIVMVDHDEFCGMQVEVSVDAPPPIILARGTRIRLSASTASGVNIVSLHADITSQNRQMGTPKWQRDSNTISSFFPDGQYIARLVGKTAQGPLYFSEPTVFSSPSASELDFVWRLKEGTEFRGQFDELVPRPVRGGWVVAHVASPKLIQNACGVLGLRWYTHADVGEDGTFQVRSLPEGTLEIVAGCGGYVSTDLSEHVIDGIRHAQIMPDDRGQPVTIPMERTGDARILVLTPSGQPLADAGVGMSPNQSLGRSTSIIGARHKSEDILEARDAGTMEKLRRESEMPRFWAKTDASGVAVICGLPPGKHRVYVSTPDYDQPIESDHGPMRPGEIRVPRRENGIVVRGGEETSAEIRMEPKGSTSLSIAINAARRRR